jgi:hypothetical protein
METRHMKEHDHGPLGIHHCIGNLDVHENSRFSAPSWTMNTPALLPWILWMATSSCYAQTLIVGLYDYSDLSAEETMRLTKTADLVFAHSGIHVAWRYCRGALAETSEPTCMGEMPFNKIVVRLQQAGSRTPDNGTMGYSIVTDAGGAYASVLVPAVRTRAAGVGMAFDLLIGYVVAHEVGHCLLGPNHSVAGLMRGAWNRRDASEISRLSLHFTKQEVGRALARLHWLSRRRSQA